MGNIFTINIYLDGSLSGDSEVKLVFTDNEQLKRYVQMEYAFVHSKLKDLNNWHPMKATEIQLARVEFAKASGYSPSQIDKTRWTKSEIQPIKA